MLAGMKKIYCSFNSLLCYFWPFTVSEIPFLLDVWQYALEVTQVILRTLRALNVTVQFTRPVITSVKPLAIKDIYNWEDKCLPS